MRLTFDKVLPRIAVELVNRNLIIISANNFSVSHAT